MERTTEKLPLQEEVDVPRTLRVSEFGFISNPSLFARATFTIVVVGLATFLRFVFDPMLGEGVPFILYFPAIVLTAWFGGLVPGLLSTALGSVIAWYAFIPPRFSFRVSDPIATFQLLVFLLSGVLISMLAETLHKAKREAERNAMKEHEEREKFRVTLTSIGDAVIATDDQGRVAQMNSIAEALTGWDNADAVGQPLESVLVIVNERTRMPAENPVHRVLREGKTRGLANHTLLLSKDGRETPIDDSAAPIQSAEGKIIGVVLVFRDITERQRIGREEALRLNDKHTRILTRGEQLARMGSWHWEPKTNTVLWSGELYKIYGIKTDTPLTFETFLGCVHPDDRESVRTAITDAMEHGKPFQIQERITRPDGGQRVLDSQGDVEVDRQGNVISLFGFCRDITEEVHVREALQEEEQRFAKMFHASPVATSLMTLEENRFLDVNTRFLELTGYRREELIQRTPKVLTFGHSSREHRRILERIVEVKSVRELPVIFRTCDGEKNRALAAIELIEIDGQRCLLTLFWRA